MRLRSTLAFVVVSSLCLSTALAQPRRGRPTRPQKASASKPVAPEKKDAAAPPVQGEQPLAPKEAGGEPPVNASGAAAPAEAGAPGGDLGAPPTAAEAAAGTKLSPLTPNANEFPTGTSAAPPEDLDRLLGNIAALRSRVAALTTTLFKSKLRVVVEAHGAHARVEGLTVTLNGGVVFAAPPRFSAEDEQIVYEHAVPPGHHVLGLEIGRYDARRREFRSLQSSKFDVVIPDNEMVEAHFVLSDDSDIAEDFPEDRDGEYELGVRLRARVTE